MEPFAITFDYLCPFARIANESVIMALEDGAAYDVAFRAFSLSQVHLTEDEPPVWDVSPRPSGVSALEWGLAVRDHFPERFHAAHLALFSARHDHARSLNDPEVLHQAVASAGLDPAEVAHVVDGGAPRKALITDHRAMLEGHRVFGVPTFVTGDRSVFVRLMQRSGTATEARETIDRLLGMVTGWPLLNEFKATSIPR